MGKRYYTIRGLSHALDGLDVQVDIDDAYDASDRRDGFNPVTRIRNRTILAGKRTWSVPVSPGLMIAGECLVACDIPDCDEEFGTDNPFGEYRCELRFRKGDVEVICNKYEHGVSVTCRDVSVEPPRTLYTQNYFGIAMERVMEYVEDVVGDELDPDDVAFGLEAIHNGELPR